MPGFSRGHGSDCALHEPPLHEDHIAVYAGACLKGKAETITYRRLNSAWKRHVYRERGFEIWRPQTDEAQHLLFPLLPGPARPHHRATTVSPRVRSLRASRRWRG